MSIIRLENIFKSFGERNLFTNLSMEIDQGDFVSIMGESGAGKTTLLNIIGMLEQPDKGSVTICGQQSLGFSSRTATMLRRNHISYLMQNYGLVDTETVEYNLAISARFKKLSKAQKKLLFSSALEQIGLPGYEKRKIYTLSGGEQQRVALAKIIVKSPQLILADEPTGIVVFCINQSVYIKRIVAVAGDTVQLTDCRVYVNGVYVYPYTCDIDSQIEYHLEEGQYFVLGDNGEASIDSRDFGVISENQLLGKAIAF